MLWLCRWEWVSVWMGGVGWVVGCWNIRFIEAMPSTDKIKEKYVADAEVMATKARFGYFSILPSHTAAITDSSAASPHRDADGRVQTQPRNLYAGASSTGTLRKNFFSYTPSAFHGSPFQDPGKAERKMQMEESKRWEGRDIYKPVKNNSALVKAAYEYMSETDPKRPAKRYRDESGKVITQSSNMLVSPQSKIEFQKVKEFKYVECPPEKRKAKVEDSKEEPFKLGSPQKELFNSYAQTYFDADVKRREEKKLQLNSIQHDTPFKPSCISPGKSFTPLVYKEEGSGKQEKVEKKENKHDQPFKLIKVEHNSKPSPSISCSKINLLRGCR